MFEELEKKRYSCRNYKDTKVEKKDLEKIVNAGRISPSARNSQPVEYYVINSEENVLKMREYLQAKGGNTFVSNMSSFIVLVLTEEMYETKKDVTRNDYTEIDTGIAVHAMSLEATSIGLATCILGRFDHEAVANLLGVDVNRVMLTLAIGYSNDDKIPNKDDRRKKMEEVAKYL